MDIENKIKEQRFAQALQKDYIGSQSKFVFIAKTIGDPIILDGAGESSCLPDFYELDTGELPTLDLDNASITIGWCLDAFKMSMGLEIVFMEEEREVKVYHKSDLVFEECEEDLMVFKPEEEWEKKVERLYTEAKRVARARLEKEQLERKANQAEMKRQYIDDLSARWGKDLFD